MSNSDSFINEVTEEVRRDRLFAMFRKYGWIAVVLVVGVVGSAGWLEFTKARDEAQAQAFGDQVTTALEASDDAARLAGLQSIQAEGGRAAVLHLLVAAQAIAAKDKPAALAQYDALVADATLPVSYRDLALLKRVMLAGAEMPMADRETALTTLATPGKSYRPLALEQQALIKVEQGDTAAAILLLRAILNEPLVTQGLRNRVTTLMVALGADPEQAA